MWKWIVVIPALLGTRGIIMLFALTTLWVFIQASEPSEPAQLPLPSDMTLAEFRDAVRGVIIFNMAQKICLGPHMGYSVADFEKKIPLEVGTEKFIASMLLAKHYKVIYDEELRKVTSESETLDKKGFCMGVLGDHRQAP